VGEGSDAHCINRAPDGKWALFITLGKRPVEEWRQGGTWEKYIHRARKAELKKSGVAVFQGTLLRGAISPFSFFYATHGD